MIESVRIIGITKDGSEKEVRTIPTGRGCIGGVPGFFDDVKDQYLQVVFEDKTFLNIPTTKLKFLLDNDDNYGIIKS